MTISIYIISLVLGMPAVKLYLDEEAYEAYKKLKSILMYINKLKRTKLSISSLVAQFILSILPRFEENTSPEVLSKISSLKIELPSLEINIGDVNIQEREAPPRQSTIPTMVLWSYYREWKRRLTYAIRIPDMGMRMKTLSKLRDDIVQGIKKFKEAPKDLLENIGKLLAKIDGELDKYYGIPTEPYEYT